MLGHDIDGDPKKYLLVGAYTWPVMEEAPWDDVEQLEVHPDKDWPTLEEEEALRKVEYDLAQDLDAHGEEMSYRPTSDEGEDQEMGDPDEGDEQHGAKETVISHSRCQIQDPVNQKCRRCHFPRLQKRLKSTRRSTRRSPCPSAYHWPRRAHQKSLPGRKNCLAC